MTALRRPDKLRRFRDGMCAVVGMVRKKKNMELQWGRSIAAGAVDCWKGVWMTNSDNGPVDARTVVSQLDATDGVILDMLEKDGRATLSHLSEATGLSVSAV